MTGRVSSPLTIEALSEAIKDATERGEAWGQNMHPSKRVLIRLPNGRTTPLVSVGVAFIEGAFALVLSTEGAPDA